MVQEPLGESEKEQLDEQLAGPSGEGAQLQTVRAGNQLLAQTREEEQLQ